MKITTVTNIELSAICDNKCKYCPCPTQGNHRPVGFMTMDTFKKTVELVKHFIEKGTQRELNLFGIGEALLNPEVVEMVKYIRKEIPTIYLHLNTNGNTLTVDLAQRLKDAGVNSIDITDHDAETTVRATRILEKVGVSGVISRDAVLHPNNWAGQVEWFAPNYVFRCGWIGDGMCMVYWNGDITTCCLDAFGNGIVGNVFKDIKDIEDIELKPFKLCEKCHHIVPIEEKLKANN